MIITGSIEEIIFRNEDNGYTVAVFLCDDNKEYINIVGTLSTANVGLCLKIEGEIKFTKYGEQFNFSTYEIIYPNSLTGIKKYLSSGLIKGVGPATANSIVETFKEDTLTVIEFSPDKLASIKGISKKKADDISKSFNDIKKMQNSVMFLQSYNISINMAIKIYNMYSSKTIEIVKNNPYKLIEDIDGIGFLTADNIAKSMGIASNSTFRIRAGIIHLLKEYCEKNGNTYNKRKTLKNDVYTLLNISEDMSSDKFEETLDNLGYDRQVSCFKNNNGEDIVMLTKLYFAESSVAQKLSVLNITSKTTDKNIEDLISHFELINQISFDEQQKNAIRNSIKCGVSIISGGPGTGKTTIVKCILSILEQEKMRVMLLAPTGRASKRLSESTGREAKTIHRGLEINFNSDGKTFVYNEQNPLNVDAVIVDEVSMVDIMLMNSLLKALPRDCKLILVGDKDQLPSVGAGNVLGDILESGVINTSYLTKIFRQDEKSLIVSNAHLINSGSMPVFDNTSKDFFYENKEDPNEIKNSVVDMVTRRLPNFTKLDTTKIQVLAPLKAGASGIENLNKELQEQINPSRYGKQELVVGKTIFREGDKVMQITNNYDLTWRKSIGFFEEEGNGVFNGDIGYIQKINYGSGETVVEFEDGRECIYDRSSLSELSLAYAITIHKSQGSEFDIVVIPIVNGPPQILNRNLIYTAITRAKKMVVLVGAKKSLSRMITNRNVVKRLTLLKEFIINSTEKLKLIYGEQ